MYNKRWKIFQIAILFLMCYYGSMIPLAMLMVEDVHVMDDFEQKDSVNEFEHDNFINLNCQQEHSMVTTGNEKNTIEIDMQEAYKVSYERKVIENSIPQDGFDGLENMQPDENLETAEEKVLSESTIDARLPGTVFLHINENSPKAPIVLLEERGAESDILVDISSAINPDLAYTASSELEICLCKVVNREAEDQPFLGKLLVAEGAISRIRSGVYGNDIPAILKQGGYGVEMDGAGVYHVYHSNGKEVYDVSEEDVAVVKIALSGSNFSGTILEKATNIRNEQYGLNLGAECYQYGAIYHYDPDLVSKKELNKRVINRVPVSFEYYDHVLYGFWLNANSAMSIA